jgi:protein-S-isoprenylcysteine O-methyltransferase Ste14
MLPRRAVDIAIGITLLSSFVAGCWEGQATFGAHLVFVGLHGLVAVLFLMRREPVRVGAWWQRGVCLLSVPMLMLALAVAPPLTAWPRQALALLSLGGMGTAASLLWLGRSFGVLPADRGLVDCGPFRWVRHPIYASEMLMVAACTVAAPTPQSFAVTGVTLALIVVRIRIEEAVLGLDASYTRYAERVRFRLIPLLW